MSEEAREQKCPPEGAPMWLATFADLMSLLMCFFVLLLAFSEMDVLKFKQLSGSMKEAFGVQREVKVKEIPKGTSIIAKEFAPGKPVPTMLKVVRQMTTEHKKQNLKLEKSESKKIPKPKRNKSKEKIEKALNKEIKKDLVEVVGKDKEIIIRIKEKGSFPSGTADLNKSFLPTMKKISFLVKSTPGKVIISGHTDNIPIYTYLFRSNWELSSSRAVSVLRALTKYQKINPQRLAIEGNAETKPIASNKTKEGRAKNRRVEIRIVQSDNIESQTVKVNKKATSSNTNKPAVTKSAPVKSPETSTKTLKP